jgi:hypothetical protein
MSAADDGEALEIPIASLTLEEHSFWIWRLVGTKLAQGEGLRETLIWAIRSGARIPEDLEFRAALADALEGKSDHKRGRGRPKKQERFDWGRAFVEDGIAKAYHSWRKFFKRDREVAWLKAEGQRLQQEHPEAAVWRGMNDDLYMEDDRKSFAAAVAALGARPCPAVVKGGEETPRKLALQTTAEQYGKGWKDVTGKRLTPAVVARLVALAKIRAKKSK